MREIEVNIQEIANQAVRFLESYPCSICSCESFCGIKYKGCCKIARKIRLTLKLYKIILVKGETETQKIPVKELQNG